MEKLLNKLEIAKLLGVKPATISNWISQNTYDIPYIKVGRLTKFRESDIRKWLEVRVVNRINNEVQTHSE
jgi:excisionase family DNA binding protein